MMPRISLPTACLMILLPTVAFSQTSSSAPSTSPPAANSTSPAQSPQAAPVAPLGPDVVVPDMEKILYASSCVGRVATMQPQVEPCFAFQGGPNAREALAKEITSKFFVVLVARLTELQKNQPEAAPPAKKD